MKTRQKVSCRISRMDGSSFFTVGERTVFGLVITPLEFEGYSITDPISGFRAAHGWTMLDALNDLKAKSRALRKEFGSFIGALDSFRRNAICLKESNFYQRQAASDD